MKYKPNFWASLGFVLALLINPFYGAPMGVAAYPGINSGTVAQMNTDSGNTNNQEILWEHEIIRAAAQMSPFADNMTGKPGSGKPIIIKNDTTKVAGAQIVIPTVDSLGSAVVQGNATRVGNEEQVKPGNFLLTIGLGWFGVGADNVAIAQTILGKDWENLSKDLLSKRLQKQQSDDNMVIMVAGASQATTVYPNNKTLDTLSSADIYSTSLIVQGSGVLKDLGALPMDARKSSQRTGSGIVPPIPRYLQFLTDLGARPIKNEAAYLDGVRLAQERGENNNLFTGDYQTWDNNVVYAWQNIRHGGYGSIGSILQPEALLGSAISARTTTASLPWGATSGNTPNVGLTGGGTPTGATKVRNYFEFFSLFNYNPINGVGQTVGFPGMGATRYFAVIDSGTTTNTPGLVSFFSYTSNNGQYLGNLTRLGSVTGGDYNTLVGQVAWNGNTVTYGGTVNAFTTAADGQGYQGVTDGAISYGSLILECNAKGVPLCRGLGLGEMALVAGYGKLPTGQAYANRTHYIAPHGAAFANGIEVSYGAAAFQRPDLKTPNYVVEVFARSQPGMPVVA